MIRCYLCLARATIGDAVFVSGKALCQECADDVYADDKKLDALYEQIDAESESEEDE